MLIVLLLTISNINNLFNNRKVLGVSIDTSSVLEQKKYYQSLVDENPTYIDGYVELSKISSFMGDKQSQLNYLKEAYILNPNNQEVIELLAQVEN